MIVRKKNDVADEVAKPLFQVFIAFRFLHVREVCLDLSLRGELGLKRPGSGRSLQKVLLHKRGIPVEQVRQHSAVDERLGVALAVKRNSALVKFRSANGNRRNEMAHQAGGCINWNAPDAEETQDVIDSERVEVTA